MNPDHPVTQPPATPRLVPLQRVNGKPAVVPWPMRRASPPGAGAISPEEVAAACDFEPEHILNTRRSLAKLGVFDRAAYHRGLRRGRRESDALMLVLGGLIGAAATAAWFIKHYTGSVL